MKAVFDSKSDILHYCIICNVQDHPAGKFYAFGTLIPPEKLEKSIHAIFNNALGIIMACIFQSLPPKVLERRFGAITSWPFSGVCLNVVPPIYQRLGLAPTTRQEFKLRVSRSSDLEIRARPRI
ncbi:hypothetical protein I7I50_12680 [Histoplasma capsulatum G186AR]|uniref:Uncharacterized protein n=1 Tax=Ajellomyces capsulatus TaxID=5037 RepID=A0A8H7Y7U7_AJECA|nr:hypothetical protein I7I52_11015 [Histoplasma capsulatum]QSS70899.1 hypothetical protein I7I50_12680 [Histoplasma capsulatum G186AR]